MGIHDMPQFLFCILLFCVSLITDTTAKCTNNIGSDDPVEATIKTTNGKEKTVVIKSCKQLMKTYPVLCENKKFGGNEGLCCKACGDTTCLDKITKKSPLETRIHFMALPIQIKSCSILVKKYTALCTEEGKEGGMCCRKCKTVKNLNCIDDFRVPDSVDYMRGEAFDNCQDFIEMEPCGCADEDTKKSCCKSCQNIDTKSLGCDCTDVYNRELRPSLFMWIDLLYHPDEMTLFPMVDRKEVNSCAEFANWYSFFCSGGTGAEMCCRTCKDVDYMCVDNLYWKTTVKSGEHECTDCSCHDIYKVSPELMRETCQNNIIGTTLKSMSAREACCHQCRRLGFNKPEGYKASAFLDYGIQMVAK